MSNTRHAQEGSPRAFERFMSSPEYVEQRGIPGGAVAAKAALLVSARKRSLLFFLQALSMRQGGLKKVALDIMAAFPERIGTETMHKSGTKPGKVYGEKEAAWIKAEASVTIGEPSFMRFVRAVNDEGEERTIYHAPRMERTAEYFLSRCRSRLPAQIAEYIEQLCINPYFEFTAPGEPEECIEVERENFKENDPNIASHRLERYEVPCFRDIIGALFEFQERHASAARAALAQTEVAEKCFTALNRALQHRKMVVLDGQPGVGKTKTVQTWAEMHLGEARYVTLSGVVNKTSIFRKVADALGVVGGQQRKAMEMQAGVESFLKRSGLALILDEAHFTMKSSERMRCNPEILDWLDTACCNEGVPLILIVTPQFRQKLEQIEDQTRWQSAQFRRRRHDYVFLPAKPRTQDVEAVTRKLFPDCDMVMVREIIARALLVKGAQEWPLSWIGDLADDALMLAREAGRTAVASRDIQGAMKLRESSDLAEVAAQKAAAEVAASKKKRRSKCNHNADDAAHAERPADAAAEGDETAATNRLSGSRMGEFAEV